MVAKLMRVAARRRRDLSSRQDRRPGRCDRGAAGGAGARPSVDARVLLPGLPALTGALREARSRSVACSRRGAVRQRRVDRRPSRCAIARTRARGTCCATTRLYARAGNALRRHAAATSLPTTAPLRPARAGGVAPGRRRCIAAWLPQCCTDTTGTPAWQRVHAFSRRAGREPRRQCLHDPQPRLPGRVRATGVCRAGLARRRPARAWRRIPRPVVVHEGGPALCRPHHHGQPELRAGNPNPGTRRWPRWPAARTQCRAVRAFSTVSTMRSGTRRRTARWQRRFPRRRHGRQGALQDRRCSANAVSTCRTRRRCSRSSAA